MICRSCLRRGIATASAAARQVPARQFTISAARHDPTAASAASTPTFTTPLSPSSGEPSPATTTAAADPSPTRPRSSCPAGTVLVGLNYMKNKQDPVALEDHEYPEWLWRCLDVKKDASAAADDGAGDEFSKSKKQRKLANRRQKQLEAKILATGDVEALAPKIPLQQQSVNLPGDAAGGLAGSLDAARHREDLRRAMRRERKAKIKEANYLKSM